MGERINGTAPWRWTNEYYAGDGRRTWSLVTAQGYGILSCDGEANSPQGLGNTDHAALIQAAPDLLAACEAYVNGTHDDRACESMMKAAIARAKGVQRG